MGNVVHIQGTRHRHCHEAFWVEQWVRSCWKLSELGLETKYMNILMSLLPAAALRRQKHAQVHGPLLRLAGIETPFPVLENQWGPLAGSGTDAEHFGGRVGKVHKNAHRLPNGTRVTFRMRPDKTDYQSISQVSSTDPGMLEWTRGWCANEGGDGHAAKFKRGREAGHGITEWMGSQCAR